MDGSVQISAFSITLFGSIITMMLMVIAYFLSRLIGQFDGLQRQFVKLNDTMNKIDKDLSGDVGVLKSRIQEFDPVWERLRVVENGIIAIQSGGCDAYRNKIHVQ